MKVVRYYAPGDVRIEEAADPKPGPGEIKLRVRACSLCGTDLKIYQYGHHRIDPPRVLGHEIAGEIVDVGAEAFDAGWRQGDRVQVAPVIPCGACAECRAGQLTVCSNRKAISYQYDGGFAEYMIVPANALAISGLNRIPDDVSYTEASVAEPLACAVNAQELARVGEGDSVVVVGSGPAGCLHIRLAQARGATRVYLVGRGPERLSRAAALVQPDAAICAGDAPDSTVAKQILELTDGRGADVVILAAASAEAQQEAVSYAARRGRISFYASLPVNAPTAVLDANAVHYRELTIVGANGASPAQNAQALDLIAQGRVPVADLITHRFPLDGIFDAFDVVARGEAVKTTIEP